MSLWHQHVARLGMPLQPVNCEGAAGNDLLSVVAGISDRRGHERRGDTAPSQGLVDADMVDIHDGIARAFIQELGIAFGEVDDEPAGRGIVENAQADRLGFGPCPAHSQERQQKGSANDVFESDTRAERARGQKSLAGNPYTPTVGGRG